jgi:hypothetical protein
MTTLADVLVFLIWKGSGRSERELAEAVYGCGANQQLVNQDRRMLADRGRVAMKGAGGSGNAYCYFPAYPGRGQSDPGAVRVEIVD